MVIDDRMKNLAKLMDVAMVRARVHAGNLAHQNTPGYKAKAVDFEQRFAEALSSGDEAKARSLEAKIYEPRTTAVDNDGNDVSTHSEVVAMAQNQLLYNAYTAALRGKGRLLNTAVSGPA
jgi:flagellar basal-body rod protein FlgB